MIDILNDYRKYRAENKLFDKDSQPDTSPESEDPSPKAKQVHSTDEANINSSTLHRPIKKQKSEHY